MDLFFAVDRAQTASFRRAAFRSSVKREAWRDMGVRMQAIARAQDNIMPILYGRRGAERGAEQLVRGVIENRRKLEFHAREVDELLGDYLTFSRAERATLQRFAMFYGFLRHSMQLALWTLPTRHPIMLGLLAKATQLTDKELRELLGTDEVPWQFAGLRFDNSRLDGLQVNFARMSPLGNAIFEAHSPAALLGVLPPAVSIPLSGILGQEFFTNTPYTFGGQSVTSRYLAMAGLSGEQEQPGLWDRVRIAVHNFEAIVPPLRYAQQLVWRDRQGDDSSLILGALPGVQGSAPIDLPKTEPYRSRVLQSQQRYQALSPMDIIGRQALGLRYVTPEQVTYTRERAGVGEPKKRRSTSSPFTTSSTKSPYTSSSTKSPYSP